MCSVSARACAGLHLLVARGSDRQLIWRHVAKNRVMDSFMKSSLSLDGLRLWLCVTLGNGSKQNHQELDRRF